ncbi:hypothetical protein J1N35_037001 [Gossypium stocksii]|uniref:Uncharacterized protein n=1 Tax=Gossypium stocksii TaxID=47602 RepID=A0A9D3ZLC5_9ROSI|nr:hypothetical protein J1N35_037001 [Gossypium stocksii]
MNALQVLLNTVVGKLTKKNEAFKAKMIDMKEENKATMTTLNTKIEELEAKLVMCKVVVGPQMKSEMGLELRLERSSKKSSMSNFTPNMSRMRLGLSCFDSYNKAQLGKSLLKLIAKKSEKYESSKPKFKPKGNSWGDKNKLTKNSDGDDELEKAQMKLGSILSCIKAKKVRKQKGLIFVDIAMEGRGLNALVDMGNSDLFIECPC